MVSSVNPPLRFFKVFQPQFSSDKLMIPPAYVERITEEIPSRVVLRNSSGKVWLVEVSKIGDHLYFQGAWSKFVVDNDLKMGEFIVFKFHRLRIFDVKILGRDGCEKEVVVDDDDEEEEEDEVEVVEEEQVVVVDEEQVESEESDEESEEDLESEEAEEMGDIDYMDISSKKISSVSKYIATPDEDEHKDEDYRPTRKYRKILSKSNGCMYITREDQEEKDIQKYLPQENPYFVTRKKQSGHEHDRLMIPRYVVKHPKFKLSSLLVLEDPKGRTWPAKWSVWQSGQNWIHGGWKDLCDANQVEKDDKIICELLSQTEQTCATIKVQIIKSGTVKSN